MNKKTEINNFLTLFLHFADYKAFALTGRLADCYYTQGDALG